MDPGTLFFLGEGPGFLESKTGQCFVGPAGQELNRYLNGLHLPHRDTVYVTNLYKEWAGGAPTKSKEPTPEDLVGSEWELQLELQTIRPHLVVCLGRWSARWFLGPVNMESVHGLLFECWWCDQCGARYSVFQSGHFMEHAPDCPYQIGQGKVHKLYVFPVVHPAAGLHNPPMAALTASDMAQLAGVLKVPRVEWPSLCWRMGKPGVFERIIEYGGHPAGLFKDYDIGLDTEGSVEKPWGFSMSAANGMGVVAKYDGTPLTLDPKARWVLHAYMHDKKVIEAMGGEIPEDSFDDTQVMAYLLGTEPQALKDLSCRHLGIVRPDFLEIAAEQQVQFSTKTGKPLKKTKLVIKDPDSINPQTWTDYAGADAADTRALKPILWKKIEALGLQAIYEVDRRVLPLYARMEQVGIPVDMDHYAEFQTYLADQLEIKTLEIQSEYPDLNPGSADQVSEVMFGHLKLPGGKKTKSGKRFTTDSKVMQHLKSTHAFVAAVIEWRELQKLKTTFVDNLHLYVKNGRLHCSLLPTRVISGRLAAKNPNTLAFPKYTVLGKRFRAGVRAPKGRRLGSWDLNQIELRVLAIDSGSEVLKQVFRDGEDLHERTRQKIFGLKGSGADAQRRAAKEVNFGIPMGITEVGLSEQMRKRGYPFPELAELGPLTIDQRRKAEAEVCKAWVAKVIDDWGIYGYIKGKHAEAKRYGYVSSLGGRIRFMGSILSPNKQIREAAEREAQAFGPQAGARYIFKTIEYRIWTEVIKPLKKEGYYIEPILDLHDDLLLEFDEGLEGLLLPLIESMMASTFELDIPITGKGAVGQKWSEL